MSWAVLDVPVHFVEQIGKTLDPVDHHPASRRRRLEIGCKEGRVGKVVLVAGLVEKVDSRRVRKLLPRPGTLAHPSNTEEIEALPGRPGQTGICAFCHVVVTFR